MLIQKIFFLKLKIRNIFLHSSFPNPFSSSTLINYTLKASTNLNLKIYNHQGQEVRNLLQVNIANTGTHYLEWDGKDDLGNQLSPGVYICQMETDGIFQFIKMVLVN